MRFTVMAAERAPTMATMIQAIWRQEGQAMPRAYRAASSAPVRAKGSAKMECSNLIISSTVRKRLGLAFGPGLITVRRGLDLKRLAQLLVLAFPGELAILGEPELRQHAADVLGHKIIDRPRLVIERRDGRHDHRASLLRTQHVFKMDAAEGRIANAEHQPAAFLERDIGGARNEVIAGARGDDGK